MNITIFFYILIIIFIFYKYKKVNREYMNLLTEKFDIIIIGNAPYDKSKLLGNKINNYDRVVRFNNFTTEGHEKYIGSKVTDWIVSDYYFLQENINIKNKLRHYDNLNLKIMIPSKNKSNIYKLNKILKNNNVFNKTKILIKDEDFKIPKKYNFESNWPSTGMLAINYFLKNYSKVTITGFNSFNPKEKSIHYYDKTKQFGHSYKVESRIIKDYINSGRIITFQ